MRSFTLFVATIMLALGAARPADAQTTENGRYVMPRASWVMPPPSYLPGPYSLDNIERRAALLAPNTGFTIETFGRANGFGRDYRTNGWTDFDYAPRMRWYRGQWYRW